MKLNHLTVKASLLSHTTVVTLSSQMNYTSAVTDSILMTPIQITTKVQRGSGLEVTQGAKSLPVTTLT